MRRKKSVSGIIDPLSYEYSFNRSVVTPYQNERADTMQTVEKTSYKKDEKKEFTPDEFAKAKTTCEFVIELIKAISRSGYYDSHHPVSQEVKKGLYIAFKKTLGDSSEIMLSCHEYEDKVDIHISGILNEPFNIRKLTQSSTSDLFVPKLKDYFERKSLNSFVIKKNITAEHFESFIDVMSEPIAESADTSKLGEYLTKSLVDRGITEVSTIFKTDIVLSRGKLPWRVSIILRRLAKDLNVVPMFRFATEDKMKVIKKQIVEDIIRPLTNNDLLKDLIVNCDIVVDHVSHFMEVDELEKLIISSLQSDAVVPISTTVFDIYRDNLMDGVSQEENEQRLERNVYLAKVLNIAAERMIAEKMPDIKNLFEQLFECKIIDSDMLPADMRIDRESAQLADEILSQTENYLENISKASSIEEAESIVLTVKRVIPAFVNAGEWKIIARIVQALNDLSAHHEDMIQESEFLKGMPDSIWEGMEERIADEYIQGDANLRSKIDEVLLLSNTMCIKTVDLMISKSQEPNILKCAVEILSQKGETGRRWAMDVLGQSNHPLSVLNAALLVIMQVGQKEDSKTVRKFLKHTNASIRARALAAMAKINQQDTAAVIIDALNDEEEKVRHQALSLIEHELPVSVEMLQKIVSFLKERISKKNINANEAGLVCGLLKAAGHLGEVCDRETLENEIIEMAAELLNEKKGILKFMKAEIPREKQDILCACAVSLGKCGGIKSKEFLKTLSRNNNDAVANTAKDAMDILDQKAARQ